MVPTSMEVVSWQGLLMSYKLKSVYGKPWSQLVKGSIPISRQTLERLGQAIVDAVVLEAKRDLAMQRDITGEPEGLPDSIRFFQSFSYKITGASTIELVSNWPYINQLIDGRQPFRMAWLTQAKGVDVVPIEQKNGVVLFRTTPQDTNAAWIHPGFARHNFVQRGVKKGRENMAKIILAETTAHLMKGNIFK